MTPPASSDEVRVALIGYGLAGRFFHGRLLATVPGLRVDAVVTGNPQRQQEARADFPTATVVPSAEPVMARPEIDLVVVATGTSSHVPLAIAAIDAGKHLVVEKPVAPTAPQVRDLIDRAAGRGVILVPFHNRRWDSDHLTLRRLLRDGALGTVLRHESRFDRWRPQPKPDAWRERLPTSDGGGVLLDLGVHLVDQALALHGPVDEVYAELFARRGGADDDVFMALAHASGVTSHLWANALAAAPGSRQRVLGTDAAYVVDQPDGQEDSLRAGQSPADEAFGVEPASRWGRLVAGDDVGAVEPERGEWRRFYIELERCLRGNGPPPVAPEDALAALEVLDRARDSAAGHRVVLLRA
jgi:scyllo-inositol 2-dehydrogenase (NADP+)